MTGVDSCDDKQIASIERFYRREIRLLQGGRYDEWLTLFAPDCSYRVSTVSVRDDREKAVSGPRELDFFDDDASTLQLRVQRALSNSAWTEHPPAALRYFVQVVDVESTASEEVVVDANFMIWQRRFLTDETVFVGGRRDTLRADGASWQILARWATPDASVLRAQSLTVFF